MTTGDPAASVAEKNNEATFKAKSNLNIPIAATQAAKRANEVIGILGSREPEIACDHGLPPHESDFFSFCKLVTRSSHLRATLAR